MTTAPMRWTHLYCCGVLQKLPARQLSLLPGVRVMTRRMWLRVAALCAAVAAGPAPVSGACFYFTISTADTCEASTSHGDGAFTITSAEQCTAAAQALAMPALAMQETLLNWPRGCYTHALQRGKLYYNTEVRGFATCREQHVACLCASRGCVDTPAPAPAATSAVPTSAVPASAVPTSAVPTSAVPTTAFPTTAFPTTAVPTTAVPVLRTPAPTATPTGTPRNQAPMPSTPPDPTPDTTGPPQVPSNAPEQTARPLSTAGSAPVYGGARQALGYLAIAATGGAVAAGTEAVVYVGLCVVALGTTNGDDGALPAALHPLGVEVFGSAAAGAVVCNLACVLVAVGAFNAVGHALAKWGAEVDHGAVRFVTRTPLALALAAAPGTIYAALRLVLLETKGAAAVGLVGVGAAVGAVAAVYMSLRRGIPSRGRAGRAYYEPLCRAVPEGWRWAVDRGEWRPHGEAWYVLRMHAAIEGFVQPCAWWSATDLALVSAVAACQASAAGGWAHVVASAACLGALAGQLWRGPYILPRDTAAMVVVKGALAVGCGCLAAGRAEEASASGLVALGVILVKVAVDLVAAATAGRGRPVSGDGAQLPLDVIDDLVSDRDALADTETRFFNLPAGEASAMPHVRARDGLAAAPMFSPDLSVASFPTRSTHWSPETAPLDIGDGAVLVELPAALQALQLSESDVTILNGTLDGWKKSATPSPTPPPIPPALSRAVSFKGSGVPPPAARRRRQVSLSNVSAAPTQTSGSISPPPTVSTGGGSPMPHGRTSRASSMMDSSPPESRDVSPLPTPVPGKVKQPYDLGEGTRRRHIAPRGTARRSTVGAGFADTANTSTSSFVFGKHAVKVVDTLDASIPRLIPTPDALDAAALPQPPVSALRRPRSRTGSAFRPAPQHAP